ncbi:MAG: glycosyltransferase [Oscillospiraceae bacterium]|nr:glycosyltransferase [Oscillospiraceae bacterium]
MRILIIGPYAPHGQVGAIRLISLSRYLIEKKHKVTVLCLSKKTLLEMDPNGLSASVPEGVIVIPYDVTLVSDSLMKKNMINQKECCTALKELLKHEIFDVALISGGPFYQFKASEILRKNHIPFIVDYRDLHLSSPEKRKRNKISETIKFWLSYPARFSQEFNCIRKADAITVVAPEMRENLSNYFHVKKGKIHVAYNGYDDAALKSLEIQESSCDIFTIGYFGKLMYYNQDLTSMLFEAIDRINEKGLKVRLLHIGPNNPEIYTHFKKHDLDGEKWYECVGQMEYRKGIELLSACNACALEYAYPEGPGTKVFDYIYLNKPIIAVLKPGISLEKLLFRFPNSFICHKPEDVDAALGSLLSGNITKLIDTPDAETIIDEYSRGKQNKRFEELMENLVMRR